MEEPSPVRPSAAETQTERKGSLSRLPPLAVSRERSIKVNSTPDVHTSSAALSGAAARPSSSSYEREAPSSHWQKGLSPALPRPKGQKGLHHKRRLCMGSGCMCTQSVSLSSSVRPLGNQPPKQCVGLSPLDRSLPLSCLSIPVPEKWREREMGDLGRIGYR